MTLSDYFGDQTAFDGLGDAILAREPLRRLPGTVVDNPRIAAGLAVYRNNVRAAYLRVLEDAFPAVRRLVGDEFFRFAAHEYFHERLPRARLVARYGDAFPAFLETFKPAQGVPYLADVARLEIEWLKSYHAAEATVPESGAIRDILAGASGDAQLILHPSVRLFSSSYPAHSIWTYNREGGSGPVEFSGGGECGFFVRPDRAVLSFILASTPFAALESLSSGRTIREALEAGSAAAPHSAGPALLSEILSLGIVTDVAIAVS